MFLLQKVAVARKIEVVSPTKDARCATQPKVWSYEAI